MMNGELLVTDYQGKRDLETRAKFKITMDSFRKVLPNLLAVHQILTIKLMMVKIWSQ